MSGDHLMPGKGNETKVGAVHPLYVGPGWCGEREHHPPHDSCRGYGAGYRATEAKTRDIEAAIDGIVEAHNVEHGESCDCPIGLAIEEYEAVSA